MNGLSSFLRTLVVRDAVNTWSYYTANLPWDNLYRYFRLSSSVCSDDLLATGWVEMTGDGYDYVRGDRTWFAGWDTADTLGPSYDTGGYLTYDVVFPLNSGTSDWPTLRQIGVFSLFDPVASTSLLYGAQPDPTFKIGPGQRLVLLSGDNLAATRQTAGLVASNGIPVP